MSSYEEDDESFEHTLLVVREVSVYKIPPRSTSGGYKCAEWLQSDKIWSGRLRVVSLKIRCEIRLEDPTSGDLFAACFVFPGQRDSSVESVLDSSRYFVLKIEDGQGKHAFIGLGFAERNEAFDFNVALSDFEKYVSRESEKEVAGAEGTEGGDDGRIDIHPAVNHRLKEGETIHINVKNKPASGTGMLSAAGLLGGVSASGKPKTPSLAPPPGGVGKVRPALPLPPNDPAAARMASISFNGGPKGPQETMRHNTDALSDFSHLEVYNKIEQKYSKGRSVLPTRKHGYFNLSNVPVPDTSLILNGEIFPLLLDRHQQMALHQDGRPFDIVQFIFLCE